MSRTVGVAVLTVVVTLLPTPGRSVAAEDDSLLAAVRAYADVMIEHGRDRYGSQHSPLFASAIDRRTHALPEGMPPAISGIRSHDRATSGSNPMHHENLYQVLYGLTAATGDARYAREADAALRWFFEHCQSPVTGLMTWGEHASWDFRREAIAEKKHGTIHEYYRPWVLFDRTFELAPEATERFARGVWEHQIADHRTGDFSRHAMYDRHAPGRGAQFPRHAGFFIATWAKAYQRTKAPVFLEAIDTLMTYIETHRSKQSGAIQAMSGRSPGHDKVVWPMSNVSLAIDLHNSADLVPEQLGQRMLASAAKTDAVFMKVPNNPGEPGGGFMIRGHVDTLEPGDTRKNADKPSLSVPWTAGYGCPAHSMIAVICAMRNRQAPHDGYRKLVLDAADVYVASDPPEGMLVFPGTIGNVIWLMLDAHELTGEAKYLDRAMHFAQRGRAMFLDDQSPLPKASSQHDHYEAITRGDTLMLAMLKLWAREHKPEMERELILTDR